MQIAGNKKLIANFDSDNNRYIISNVPEIGITIGDALIAIKSSTHISWKKIAEFCGLRNQSAAFRAAYITKNTEDKRVLSEFLVTTGNVAYLYDKDHKPESSSVIPITASITNSSNSLIKVVENIPERVTTRITISDPLNRVLKMKVTPSNGFIIGMNDVNISSPDTPFSTAGTPKTLNNVLKTIHFVPIASGDASVTVVIDDGEGLVSSINSAEVLMKVSPGEQVSVPEITVAESVSVTAGVDTALTGVEVSDEDDKLLELKITPFGCAIYGFSTYLYPIESRGTKIISGRPDVLNTELEGLKIRTDKDCTKAQIGFELLCGSTIIRKYLVLNVTEAEEQPTENPAPVTDTATADNSVLGE